MNRSLSNIPFLPSLRNRGKMRGRPLYGGQGSLGKRKLYVGQASLGKNLDNWWSHKGPFPVGQSYLNWWRIGLTESMYFHRQHVGYRLIWRARYYRAFHLSDAVFSSPRALLEVAHSHQRCSSILCGSTDSRWRLSEWWLKNSVVSITACWLSIDTTSSKGSEIGSCKINIDWYVHPA